MMSTIKEKSKELLHEVEDKVEHGLEVTKEVLGNVARHLPLANFARHGSNSYDIEIDLPGIKTKDIELKIENNYLTVNATRKNKKELKESDYYLYESSFGLISRSFALPKGVDKDKISATLEDGRLYISMEKEEAKKAKSIAIK